MDIELNLTPAHREFFDAIGPAVEKFIGDHNLKLEKWIKDIPAWALHFRHPKGGVGQIVVSSGPVIAGCWWRDDYDSESRRVAWGEQRNIPREEPGFTEGLAAELGRILDWDEEDLGKPNVMPKGMWRRTWTEEQFEAMEKGYPYPVL